jgi:hypothetical protein
MNKAYSKVFNDQKHKEISAPDIFTWEPNEDLNVPENLVLCRDENGVPTAVYGAAKWDFAPYRLSAVREQVFHFRLSDDEQQSDEEVELIVELKRLLFCIMYFAESGKAGSLATGTLESYFTVLRMAARFCLSMGKRGTGWCPFDERVVYQQGLFTSICPYIGRCYVQQKDESHSWSLGSHW